MNYLSYLIIGLTLTALIITILCCKKYVVNTLDIVDRIFDRILEKDTSLWSEVMEDTRISKFSHKVRRITDIYLTDISKVKNEKETIQSFISDLSHQMKTPLSSILMYTDILIEGNLSSEEQLEFFNRVKLDTEKLQWMTDSLIKMSRLEIGAIQLSPIEANIRQTIYESISGVVAIAANKNINITISPFDETLLYHDLKWTREALNNILENAIKYSPVNGSVEVSVEPLSLYTKIIITDHGIGIDQNDFNLIYKRFYRGQNARNFEGTGLGLYLASIIMDKQGGYIMVDSKPYEFTTFSLFLQNCKN